jgi:hypothetical protein
MISRLVSSWLSRRLCSTARSRPIAGPGRWRWRTGRYGQGQRLERGEARGMPFGLMCGVAAGGHQAQHPAGRVDPGGAEGGPRPVDQPGTALRHQHVVWGPVRVGQYRTGEDRGRFWVIKVGLPALAPTAGTANSRHATGVTASPRNYSAPGSDSPRRRSAGSRTVLPSAISTPSLIGRESSRSRPICSGSSFHPAVALTTPGKKPSSRQLRKRQHRPPVACRLPTD